MTNRVGMAAGTAVLIGGGAIFGADIAGGLVQLLSTSRQLVLRELAKLDAVARMFLTELPDAREAIISVIKQERATRDRMRDECLRLRATKEIHATAAPPLRSWSIASNIMIGRLRASKYLSRKPRREPDGGFRMNRIGSKRYNYPSQPHQDRLCWSSRGGQVPTPGACVSPLRMVVIRTSGESSRFLHAHSTVQGLSHLNGVQERERETRVPQRIGQLGAPPCDAMLWQ
jgi:hypothetical protein